MGEFINLEGSIIGNWKVIRYKGNSMWECECQCRNKTIKDVHRYSLLTGRSTSCGKCNSKSSVEIGDTFGDWTVIGEKDKNYKVLCRCSCNKEKKVSIYSLKNGRSTNCGHLKNLDRVQDLTNQVFGELTVKKYLGNQYWECECSCGSTCIKHRNHLLDGRATSCGHSSIPKPEDLTGWRSGKLEVIKYAGNKKWLCHCDCGNYKVIRSRTLKDRGTKSCGCIQFTPNKDELIDKIREFTERYKTKPSITDLANYLDIPYKVANYHLNKYGLNNSNYMDTPYSSVGEKELYRFVCSICKKEVLHNVHNIINPYELDIYIPELNIAIEYNGVYWHSDINKDKNYHLNKMKACNDKGIELINIYEYDWYDEVRRKKVENMLSSILNKNTPVKYKLIQLNINEAIKFNNELNLNGDAKSDIRMALKDTSGLLALMTFVDCGDDRYIINRYTYSHKANMEECLRILINEFIKFKDPKIIAVRDDADKLTTSYFVNNGFLVSNSIIEKYVWACKDDVISCAEEYIANLNIDNKHDIDSTMMKLGYLKVYTSGIKTLIWTKNKLI